MGDPENPEPEGPRDPFAGPARTHLPPPPPAAETPPAAPPPRPSRPPRGPTPGQIQRRRFFALVVLTAIAAFVAIKLLTGGGSDKPASVPVPEDAAKAAKGLSTEEKIATVLAVGYDGTEAPHVADTQGGVVIGPANWAGASAAPSVAARIHAGGRIPPLVIGVQEGGQYRSYPDLPPAERELDLGDSGNAAAAEASAERAAKAMKKAGFDLNLAPVADVATLTSPLAGRAYGDESSLVAAMTSAAVKGCEAGGLLCAPSHFPGQGAANADTGDGPASVSLDQGTLLDRDVPPFAAAFAAGAPAVVLSHAFYAAYDAVTPGSLTAPIVTDLLRGQLKFKGAAITDDLSAGAIRGGDGAGDAAVQALAAGADLLVVSDPADAKSAHDAVAKAIADGQFSKDRLDEAAGRVLALKKAAGIDISM
jgi:beta-N-acetylhexosaminidase